MNKINKQLTVTIRYDTRCYLNVRSKADISQLNLPHRTNNEKVEKGALFCGGEVTGRIPELPADDILNRIRYWERAMQHTMTTTCYYYVASHAQCSVKMQPTVADVAWSVCVCALDTNREPYKNGYRDAVWVVDK